MMLKSLLVLSSLSLTAQPIISLSQNSIENYSVRKTNISSIKPKPIRVDLSYAKEDEVMTYLVLELIDKNSDIPEIFDIGLSVLYEPELWTILGFDPVIPKPGEEKTYNITFFAKPEHDRYMGIMKFDATLFNNNWIYNDIIIESGSRSIVDTTVDKNDEWNAGVGSVYSINILNYAPSAEIFFEKYKTINIFVDYKHEDEAKYGDGLIASTFKEDIDANGNYKDKQKLDKEPIEISIQTVDILKRNDWSYPSVSKNNAKNIFDNWGKNNSLDNSLLVNKHTYRYTQNIIYRLVGLDIRYLKNSEIIEIRTIGVAGKFRSGWNQANVHSRVTSSISEIHLPVTK